MPTKSGINDAFWSLSLLCDLECAPKFILSVFLIFLYTKIAQDSLTAACVTYPNARNK